MTAWMPGALVPAVKNDVSITAIGRNTDLWSSFGETASGLVVPSEQMALRVSAVYACVNLIAGAVSAMTVNMFRRSLDGERDQIHNDQLWWVLNEQFTPRWAASAGWEFLVQSLLLQGDGFARIIRGASGAIVGLEPIHPLRVAVYVTPDAQRLIYAVSSDPQVPGSPALTAIDQDDMLHIPGFGFDGRRGLSPLRYALSMTTSVAIAAQDYSARFFTNSARPDLLLSTEQPLNPEKAKEIQGNWSDTYGGTQNSHKVAVVGQGVKVQQITMSSEDAQLLATRQFQIEEIARVYGIPPFMIGSTDKTTSWGSGVESMGTGFVRYTLRQHLNKFQGEINRKFFRTASRFAEFDTTELTRASTSEMFTAFRTAIGTAGAPGFMTADEIRQKLNLKKMPGGDALFSGVAPATDNATKGATANA